MSPKKVFEDEEGAEIMENLPRVKQMTRKIGPVTTNVVDMIQSVDIELSEYINAGWKLSFVQRLATEPDGHTILYVLTKD